MNKLNFSFVIVLIAFLVACSTEKNTLLSRSYHGTTAHYNGYFNANELLNTALTNYRSNLKENYYAVLPVMANPNAEEVKNMYAPIDTAISKCKKVIQRHAMPSMDNPMSKKAEHNRWIDENWITIGIANYYRRDYELAYKNFDYAKKFFTTDKSAYIAQMWMARVNIEQNKLTEANFDLTELEKVMETSEDKESAGKETKKAGNKKNTKKGKKSKKDKKEPAPFPKKLAYDVAITRAMYCEKKKDVEGEIKALELALKHAKKKKDKARAHFILGQLYENTGKRDLASKHYSVVKKYNPNYEMSFNAELKGALNSSGEKVRAKLKKMLRDTKNSEFKDQIYYTLAQMDQHEGNEPKAIEDYTKSAFYSTSNKRQKGMAYEKLGDISFNKKDYVAAQKYYDSCAKAIPLDYPNYDGIKNKATKLQSLVRAIETAQYEDSVLRIAEMSPADREAFAENVLKKIKKDEEQRKLEEARKMEELRARQDQVKATNQGGGKWYWNNEKARTEGFEEFRKQWGQRENEDNWRRSEKIVFAINEIGSDTSATTEATAPPKEDSLTAESLLAKVPQSDSAIEASRKRMMNAYFDAGVIYQEQLNEKKLAEKQFQTVIDKPFESDMKLLSAYQIYKLYSPEEPMAQTQKDYILINYPNSDYAGYLRDPDYFIKKKEREKLTLEEYLADLDKFERGLYYPVVLKANNVLATQPLNPYRPKYLLLKAYAQAKLHEDKTQIIPTLDTLLTVYPKSDEAKKAAEMKKIILGGYSKNEPVVFTNKSIYKYKEGEKMLAVIFLDEKVNVAIAKTRVADFDKEYYSRLRLNVMAKVFKEQNVLVVKEFENEYKASEYVSMYKKTRNHLLDMQKMKIIFISEDNFRTLFETFKLEEYQLFFDENY